MIRAAALPALLALLAAAPALAQSLSTVPPSAPLAEEPAGTNSVLVIQAGDLGDRTIVMEINGTKVAELKTNGSFRGVYSPGRVRFTFPGDSAYRQVDTFAIANEEHFYEMNLVTDKGAFFGSSGPTRPVLVLKERKTIVAGYVPPPDPAKAAKTEAIPVTDLQAAQKQVIAKRLDAGAWRELGRQYLAVGDAGRATRAYGEALRLQAGDLDALEALGAIYAGAGQKEKVLETGERIEKLDKARAERFFLAYPR
jgi:tetratricopeptide (TPR) repeat protein